MPWKVREGGSGLDGPDGLLIENLMSRVFHEFYLDNFPFSGEAEDHH